MSFPPLVERWRQLVTWECRDLPVNYVLAVIQYESGGHAGRESRKKRPTTYPMVNRAGQTIQVDRDLGLMQVSPILAKTFNDSSKQGPQVTYDDMIGNTERDCRLQIRVGCYGLAFNVRALQQYFPSIFSAKEARNAGAEQLLFALIGNAVGPFGLRQRLNTMQKAGVPLTWANFSNRYMGPLGPWIRGVDARWDAYVNAGPGAAQKPERDGVIVTIDPTLTPAPGPSTAMQINRQPDYSMQPMGPLGPTKKGTVDWLVDMMKDNWWILLLLGAGYLLTRDKNGETRLNGLLKSNGVESDQEESEYETNPGGGDTSCGSCGRPL